MRATGSRGGGAAIVGHRARAGACGAAIAALVALAAFLRLWQIDSQPGGLYPDEAAEGYDAWKILHVPGFHPLFFDDDGGREAPFAYLVAGVFRVLGPSVATLRGTAAVLGVLAVAVTPLALRRFGRPAQLAGTAWAAGALWLVCIDRDGFRDVLVPLVGTLALAALLAWIDAPSRRLAVLAGGACAAGLWTYQPLKFVPLWVVIWLLLIRQRHPERWVQLRRHLGAGVVAYAAVGLPLAYVALTDPAGYFNRNLAVAAGNPTYAYSDLPIHWLRTVAMFGITGDPNQRHNVSAVALLPPLVAVVAAFGVARCWRHRHEPGHLLLLVGLPVFVLPGLLGVEGDAPHFLRALGLAPILAALVGLGAVEAARLGSGLWGGRRGLVAGAVLPVLALTAMTVQSATLYFGRDVATRYHPYTFDLVALADASNHDGSVVVIDGYSALAVLFLTRDHPPLIVDPAAGAAHLAPGTTVVARSRADLSAAFGGAVASAAEVVARDPAGQPSVYRVQLAGG